MFRRPWSADLPPDSPLLREEIFGPLLAVIRAETMDEALAWPTIPTTR